MLAALPTGSAVAFEWTRHPSHVERHDTETPPRPRRFTRLFDASHFLKGNLHTHTNRSDGDSSPTDVIRWYRAHGYRFLALTDHNKLSDPSRYASLQDGSFVLIRGEEVTMTGAGRQVHVNSLCAAHRIGGGTFPTQRRALLWATARIAKAGGVALINHPNFDHALSLDDLLAVRNAPLLEIMSGHPYVFSEGTADRPSHEALWDEALAAGATFAPVGVDDMHRLHEGSARAAYPGRAWVQVFGDTDDPKAICSALREGSLYASTGAELTRVRVTDTTYEVTTAEPAATVTFIGKDGHELMRSPPLARGETARYVLHVDPDSAVVRARVLDVDGKKAWTPAVTTTEDDDGSTPRAALTARSRGAG